MTKKTDRILRISFLSVFAATFILKVYYEFAWADALFWAMIAAVCLYNLVFNNKKTEDDHLDD